MGEREERQARLVVLQDECKAALDRLDLIVEQFKQIIPRTAAAWIEKEFNRGIIDNAEQVQGLGINGFRLIKEDMDHLIRDLPNLVAELLRNRSAWPHHKEEVPSRQSVHKEFFFDHVFRNLVSTAGAVLERHNLLGNCGLHSHWQHGKAGWRYGVNSTTPVLPELNEEYTQGLDQLRDLRLRFHSERKKLAEARAQALWEAV